MGLIINRQTYSFWYFFLKGLNAEWSSYSCIFFQLPKKSDLQNKLMNYTKYHLTRFEKMYAYFWISQALHLATNRKMSPNFPNKSSLLQRDTKVFQAKLIIKRVWSTWCFKSLFSCKSIVFFPALFYE